MINRALAFSQFQPKLELGSVKVITIFNKMTYFTHFVTPVGILLEIQCWMLEVLGLKGNTAFCSINLKKVGNAFQVGIFKIIFYQLYKGVEDLGLKGNNGTPCHY